MKILFITTTSTTSYAFLMELALELVESNNEVEFAFNSDSFMDAPSKLEEIEGRGFKVHDIKFSRRISLLNDSLAALKLFKLINNNNYDIVHSHTSKAGFISRFICKLTNQYNIHTAHDLYYRAFKKGFKRNFFILLEKFASYFADKILFVSEAVLDSAVIEGIAPIQRLFFVSNGIIPKNKFESTNAFSINESKTPKNDKFKIVGVVSRLVENKSVDTFIKAAIEIEKKDPNIKFIIIGNGPLLNELKKIGIDLLKKDRLFFLDNVKTKKELESIVKTFDAFLFPTIREGLGIVILEAFDLGIPVITTNLAPMNTIVNNNLNGFLCQEKEYKDFAKKTLEVLNNDSLRSRFILESYKILNAKFNLKQVNKKIIKIYYDSITK
jgi:glycosyltransferase involved in cell wall biosynthesis